MERVYLFPLLADLAGIKRQSLRDLGARLRSLAQHVSILDDPPSDHTAVMASDAAAARSRKRYSDLGLVRTDAKRCDPAIYCYRPYRSKRPGPRSARREFLENLLHEAKLKNVSGRLAEAAADGRGIKSELDWWDRAFAAHIACQCDQLQADYGLIDRPGAPAQVLEKQVDITKQYAAQGNRIGKAVAVYSQATTIRSQAFYEPTAGAPSGIILREALGMADLCRDTVADYDSFGDQVVHHQSLYIRTRIVVDAKEGMSSLRRDVLRMIELSLALNHDRFWIDDCRSISGYFILFGRREEALECLAYLAQLIDGLPYASIFTQTSTLLKMMAWARMSGLPWRELIAPFCRLLNEHRVVYFLNRFELEFGPLSTFINQAAIRRHLPFRFASRPATLRYFDQLFS